MSCMVNDHTTKAHKRKIVRLKAKNVLGVEGEDPNLLSNMEALCGNEFFNIFYQPKSKGGYANIPICNTCKYRPKDAGGIGGCSAYKFDSHCIIKRDMIPMLKKLNFSNPDHLKKLIDGIIKVMGVEFFNTLFQNRLAKATGEPIAKNDSEKTLLTLMKIAQISQRLDRHSVGSIHNTFNEGAQVMVNTLSHIESKLPVDMDTENVAENTNEEIDESIFDDSKMDKILNTDEDLERGKVVGKIEAE